MKRTEAIENCQNSEIIARSLGKKIPALSAKLINGTQLQKFQGHYYLIYDWIEGKTKSLNELDSQHSEFIGGVLADIHTTDFMELNLVNSRSQIQKAADWDFYLQKGRENRSIWLSLFSSNISSIFNWNEQAIEASQALNNDWVISHRDLDPKNVMWTNVGPVIIDWESAGFIHPMLDLIETALYWSEKEKGHIHQDRFSAFLSGYKKHGNVLNTSWENVMKAGFSAKLDWLEYNLKRSLRIECGDDEEQHLGTEQVIKTIQHLNRYADQIPLLLRLLNEDKMLV
ncbi:MAG: phosphotransferase [Bacillota bacterium]